MATVTARDARQRLFTLIASVNEDHVPVVITSKAGNAVLVAEEDFEAWQTTRHLFSTRANATHLLDSLAQAGRGESQAGELDLS
ncbi:MAG: type II toxin-antitoxin system Phd/YefM family antitoxin [Propionibacteriaceae bacterium]|jgi:antitoxin YefM|nr:type II toxin-antitoxin system Phd/YefM family antitoxin [Propionibacteriaceae bacterium]